MCGENTLCGYGLRAYLDYRGARDDTPSNAPLYAISLFSRGGQKKKGQWCSLAQDLKENGNGRLVWIFRFRGIRPSSTLTEKVWGDYYRKLIFELFITTTRSNCKEGKIPCSANTNWHIS